MYDIHIFDMYRIKSIFFRKLTNTLAKYVNSNDKIIVAGDFNCTYDPTLDNLGGEPHPKGEIQAPLTVCRNSRFERLLSSHK